MASGRAPRPSADGILVLYKPKDVTSMDMVRMAKRVSRVKKVGHAGTLDPIATGILPICFGQATRLMEFMVDGRKVYRAEITLGSATDTYDALGTVTGTGDASAITRDDLESLLPSFLGVIPQEPPMYSAIKHEGQRLYDLARAGVEVEREARDVVVHNIEVLEFDLPKAVIEVECGRGFYVRTLANDIGLNLGCFAHMSELERRRTGVFTLDDALTPEDWEAAGEDDAWRDLLEPPDAALRDMAALSLDSAAERHIRNGQSVTLPATSTYAKHMEPRRAYSPDGRFLAIVRFNRPESSWQPERVFSLAVPSPYAP